MRTRNENLPILYENVMLGLRTPLGQDAFLWAVEQPGEDRYCYRAERFAHEVEHMVLTIRPWLSLAAAQHKERGATEAQGDDLMGFILTRHANERFEGNKKPHYVKGLTHDE